MHSNVTFRGEGALGPAAAEAQRPTRVSVERLVIFDGA